MCKILYLNVENLRTAGIAKSWPSSEGAAKNLFAHVTKNLNSRVTTLITATYTRTLLVPSFLLLPGQKVWKGAESQEITGRGRKLMLRHSVQYSAHAYRYSVVRCFVLTLKLYKTWVGKCRYLVPGTGRYRFPIGSQVLDWP